MKPVDSDAVVEGPAVLGLDCGPCIQDARQAEALGREPLPILPARTIVQGMAICDVEGRHRLIYAGTPQILIPGQ